LTRSVVLGERPEGDEAVDADPKLIIVILRTFARRTLATLQKKKVQF
jgi:hypothetical protein